MRDYEALARLQSAKVALGSVFGWGRRTDEDDALMIRIAERAGSNPTQEQVADAIALETGRNAAVVQRGHRTWVRGDHPDDEGLNPNDGTILYLAQA